jgi:hypothetical protein
MAYEGAKSDQHQPHGGQVAMAADSRCLEYDRLRGAGVTMRLHWLVVAMKFVLLAVLLKIVLVLLALPLLLVDYRAATRYWHSLFHRTAA